MKLKKILTGLACVALGATLVACDDGETSDPATASRSDLNPPGTLETITGDSQLTLWWTAGNVEEEFKGYYVFAAKEATPGAYSYPAGVNVQTVGIPRCADNTAFFEAFGLDPTERECEAATETEDGEADADAEAFGLQDDGEEDGTDTVDVEEKLENWIPCVDDSGNATNENLSHVPAAFPAVTPQSCTINQYYDGTKLADMVNGETYMFFVVAVMGDDLSQISWTTPLVSDTPSLDVYSQDDLTLNAGTYKTFDIVPGTTWTADFSAETACGDPAVAACGLSSTNSMTVDADNPQIFIGRALASASYPQRIYISGSTEGSVLLQPRGPQTSYGDTTGATRIPGDEAASNEGGQYPTAGVKYVVYEDQIFDFEVTQDGKTYYGKLHIDTVNFAGDAAGAAATLKVAAVLQTQAGQTHYVTFQ